MKFNLQQTKRQRMKLEKKSITQKIIIKTMRVKIKIKNKLEGIKKILI